jgi:hypothetical protein
MDVSDLSAESWFDFAQLVDVQQVIAWQDEIVQPGKVVEDPICLFGQFVSAVSSDTLKNIQSRSKVSPRLLLFV